MDGRSPYRPVIRSRGQGTGDLGFVFSSGEAPDVSQPREEPAAGFKSRRELGQEADFWVGPGEFVQEKGLAEGKTFDRDAEVDFCGFPEAADGDGVDGAQADPVEVVDDAFLPGGNAKAARFRVAGPPLRSGTSWVARACARLRVPRSLLNQES